MITYPAPRCGVGLFCFPPLSIRVREIQMNFRRSAGTITGAPGSELRKGVESSSRKLRPRPTFRKQSSESKAQKAKLKEAFSQ
jgi:hypothetical protein